MNSQQARQKLSRVTGKVVGHPYLNTKERDNIMAAADVAMLAVHVEACGARQNTDEGWRRGQNCGDGWYCGKAPRRDA